MINHHPDENILTEYASGSLPVAMSLAVCTHLQVCAHCSARVSLLNKLGASLLTHSSPEPLAKNSFERVMEKIRQTTPEHITPANSSAGRVNFADDPLLLGLPKVVQKLLPASAPVKWRRVSAALKMVRLALGQQDYEVALQRISSGGCVVEHNHSGVEITVVLRGSFSDEFGVYHPGDFLVRDAGEVHRPTAALNEDCLCLSVASASVQVTGWLGKIINPFLRFQPA